MIASQGKLKFLKEKLSRPILIFSISALFAVLPTKFAFAFEFLDMIAWVGGSGAKGVTAILLAFLWPILLLVNTLLGTILYISGFLFNWALELSAKHAPFVETGWTISLQFANMFFIIILLAIAISIILEVGEQSLGKKALPKFLAIALLINFSMAIGNIFIDAANVFAKFFSNAISGSSLDIAAKVMYAIQLNSSKFADQSLLSQMGNAVSNMSNIFGIFIYQIVFQVVAIFMMLAGAVYMISRAFWLWLLLILSPLAWIAMIIPGQKKHWDNWWDQFIKWALFAPVFLFFTYLALLIGGQDFTTMVSNADGIKLGGTESGTDFFNAGALIKLAITAFLMTTGIIAGHKMGVGGANFIVSGAKSAGGAAKKRFSELRGKPLAERAGKWAGTFGAGVATFGGTAPWGKAYRTTLEKERLEGTRKKIQEESEKFEGLTTAEIKKRIETEKGGSVTQAALIKQLMSRPKEERGDIKKEEWANLRRDLSVAYKAMGTTGTPATPFTNKQTEETLREVFGTKENK